jgi:acyl-CoA thioesterase I
LQQKFGGTVTEKSRLPQNIWAYLLVAALWLGAGISGAYAAHIDIVALGASNTAGYGVGTNAAWPAQLEALLKAKGYDVTVVNAGVSGETSSQILSRVDAVVTAGVKLVVLQILGGNDQRHGVGAAEHDANVQAAVARIRAHGAHVVLAGPDVTNPLISAHHQFDGIHLTEEGHAKLAQRLLPLVIAAIGQAK